MRRSPAAWPAAVLAVHAALWAPGTAAAGTELAGSLTLIWPVRTLSGAVCPPGNGYRVLLRDPLRPSVAGLSGHFTVRAPGLASLAPPRPAAVSPRPDLQVLCRNAGGPAALILNRGAGPSLPTVVAIQKRVAIPGSREPILISLGERPVPPLDAYCETAGCRCRFELQLGAPDGPWFDGATIVLTVDPHDAVTESDETNNRCVLVVPPARSRRGH